MIRRHTQPPSCTFDRKGNKTSDCRRCDCARSDNYGDHSDYGGKCVHCGAPTR